MPSIEEFLGCLKRVLGERESNYGSCEPLFQDIAKRWSLTLKTPVSAQQVALCMIELKLARLCHSPQHLDSLIDIAGYAACAASLHPFQG